MSGSGTPAAGTGYPGVDVDAVAAALLLSPVSLMGRDEPSSPDAVPERAELERLYAQHNPAKLEELDNLIQKCDCL